MLFINDKGKRQVSIAESPDLCPLPSAQGIAKAYLANRLTILSIKRS